jgi:hypothetical protein
LQQVFGYFGLNCRGSACKAPAGLFVSKLDTMLGRTHFSELGCVYPTAGEFAGRFTQFLRIAETVAVAHFSTQGRARVA